MMRFGIILAAVLFLICPPLLSSDFQITTLENGLRVMIKEYRQVPQVNISTTVRVGAKNETDFFDGATHLLEHLILFRGTEKMSGDEVGQEMKRHGAYFNGFTSQDWTDFIISLPKENLDFALQIHSAMLFHSNFTAEAMDEERNAVLEEININEDDPGAKAYYSMLRVLYKDHPYEKDILGPKENISGIPRDSVYAYYKRYYAPNNMTMVIVGDIDADSTLNLVKKYFGSILRGETPQDTYSPPGKRTRIDKVINKKDVSQVYLIMSGMGPKANSPDQPAMDVLVTILGGGESSRLWKKLKEESGLVYSISYNFYTSKYEGPVLATAITDPDKVSEVEKAVVAVLEEVRKNGVTAEELRKVKNQIKTGYYTGMEAGLDIANNYAQYDSYIGYEFIRDYPINVEKVTLQDVKAVAAKYLNNDSYVVSMVVPK